MGLFDRLRDSSVSKVVVIGLDGVPYRFLTEGPVSFPAIEAIADAGAAGSVDSITPPAVSACWAALTTGVNPGKTGVYGFQDREVGSYDTYVPTGGDVQAPRVWDVAEEAGASATVMNVPVTFPPQRTVSRMVTGNVARDIAHATHPQSMAVDLEQMDYRLGVDASLGREQEYDALIEDATETLTKRMEAFRRYLGRDDWSLFCGVFTTPDPVNHFFYDDYLADGAFSAEVEALYRRLASYIDEIRARLDEETTLVVTSDHGFHPLRYEFDLNRWLAANGYLSFTAQPPAGLGDVAAETRAYALDSGRIYINRAGREPRGVVDPADAAALVTELIDALSSVTGPDGSPAVEAVHRGGDLFEGPHTDIAPDLVVSPATGFDLTATFDTEDPIFTASHRSGAHSRTDAALLVDDPGATIDESASILDVTPTVLDSLGVADDLDAFDGRSLL